MWWEQDRPGQPSRRILSGDSDAYWLAVKLLCPTQTRLFGGSNKFPSFYSLVIFRLMVLSYRKTRGLGMHDQDGFDRNRNLRVGTRSPRLTSQRMRFDVAQSQSPRDM